MKLYPWLTISDEEKFVKTHTEYSKNPHKVYDAYRKRLEDYYKLKNKEKK